MGDLAEHWPLLGLQLTTPRLRLRLPSAEELAELADLAAEGVHDPDRMPFLVPWTDKPPAERARSVVQHYWRRLAEFGPEEWTIPFAVFVQGTPVGMQDVSAHDFGILREVGTGSWLGRKHHGQGIGTEMRAAVLQLAFEGLGADLALSGAFDDNPASIRVSLKLGYEPDGIIHQAVRERRVIQHRLRLTRERWEEYRQVPVTLSGLRPCLQLLGTSV